MVVLWNNLSPNHTVRNVFIKSPGMQKKDTQMNSYDKYDKWAYVEYWRDLEMWVTRRRSINHRRLSVLLVCHCNYGRSLYLLRNKARH